jgi:type IX secretion system PorP/SprF family membrane protein
MRYILLLLFFPSFLLAQQLPDRSAFSELAHVWNPAMTATYNYWEISANFRQQWLGFENAPQTGILAAQYPFAKENMSIGGYFMHDRIQPLKFSTLGFNYAYRFNLGITRFDRAAIGASLTASQYFVDALNVVVNDLDDQLLPTGENGTLGINAGIGFFYTSYAGTRRQRYDDKNAFFFGVAMNQVFPADLIIQESNTVSNWKREMHGNALIGARLVNTKFFIEPSVWVNYSAKNNLNGQVNIKMEMKDAFWTAITYSTNQTMAVQVGLITAAGFSKSDYMRIGALGSYNVGNFGDYRAVGFEVNVAYRFNMK